MTTKANRASIPEFDKKRRDNAEVKVGIAEVIEQKGEALKKALALLKEADQILRVRHSEVDDELYSRATSAVWRAKHEVEHTLDFNFSSDIYIENKAHGLLGAAVLKDIEAKKVASE